MNWRVPLADLNYDLDEEHAIRDVLWSRWLTMGAITQQFEHEFAAFLGVKHALAVSNATVALHLALLALDIGPGDEVIAPALTFVATTNVILYTGAEVRFADICGAHDLNIAPAEIEKQITPRSRAIIVVHYGGFACQMDRIAEIAARHKLAIIEDAAHAPDASLDGTMLGTWGAAGCFSFFGNKNLSTGEGGMLVTNRDDIAARVRVLRSHGMTTLTWDRHQGHASTYDVTDLGYNYRIDELRSALGRAQLGKLRAGNARRQAIAQTYWERLSDTALVFPFRDAPGISAHHLFPILLPEDCDRTRFMDAMRAEEVQTSIHYPPIHLFTYYRNRYPAVLLPVTEALAAREVTLPLYPTMSDTQVELVLAATRHALHTASA
jgi:dTDP-4-amino-4,6-dideoxygalactose transaminase